MSSIGKLLDRLTPFQQARIKLTFWYVMILGVLIIGFTLLVLNARESSFLRVYRVVEDEATNQTQVMEFNDQFEEFSRKFEERLFVFDVILFGIATVLAYFLSGRTLEPIRVMMEEQAEFSADVSHELRTPLTTMGVMIEAELRQKKDLKTDRKDLLVGLKEEVDHMTQIVEGLLTLVRVRNTDIQDKGEKVELMQLIEEAVGRRVFQLNAKRQKCTTKWKCYPVTVKGYKEQLLQVMIILVDNAIKYSPVKSAIRLELTANQSQAVVKIANPGKGIEAEDLRRIFDRFYRGKKNNKVKGTGLGLAIAKKIVDYHKGDIKVKSSDGKGTEFTVRLPLA